VITASSNLGWGTEGSNPVSSSEESSAKPRNFAQPVQSPGGGIRLEISSDLDGDEEDLQVIRSCSMSETELRAELETISTDKAWIDEMVAAMTPLGLGRVS
jgi:hypothetical protein